MNIPSGLVDLFFKLIYMVLVYLAVPDLSYGTWNLGS